MLSTLDSTMFSCDCVITIAHEIVDHAANGLVELPPGRRLRISRDDRCVEPREHSHFLQFLDVDQPGAHAVIHIVIVVRDGIGEVGELRLEPGLRAIEESFADIAELIARSARSNA